MISGVLLAAGSSRRMGRPKLLLELGGKPLVRRAAETALAAGLDDLVVVVGPHRVEIERALAGLPVRFAENPEHHTGMASSLRTGVAALPESVEAAVILLGDQPFQQADVVERIVHAYRSSGKPVVVATYAGRRGNPVLFQRTLFGELSLLEGEHGGRSVVAADPSRVAEVPFDDDLPQRDLDTWEEYLAARNVLERS